MSESTSLPQNYEQRAEECRRQLTTELSALREKYGEESFDFLFVNTNQSPNELSDSKLMQETARRNYDPDKIEFQLGIKIFDSDNWVEILDAIIKLINTINKRNSYDPFLTPTLNVYNQTTKHDDVIVFENIVNLKTKLSNAKRKGYEPHSKYPITGNAFLEYTYEFNR